MLLCAELQLRHTTVRFLAPCQRVSLCPHLHPEINLAKTVQREEAK